MTRPDLSLVVPAFDEVNRIEVTLERIAAFLTSTGMEWELIVVLDGGPRAMEVLAQRAADGLRGVQILVNDRNHGKGYSVRRGVLASTGRIVGFLDADLAQPVEALPPFLERVAGGARLVIGTRRTEGRGTGLCRRIASSLFGRIARTMLRLPFKDTQCGMKVFDGNAARALFRVQRIDRFAFDAEVLLIARSWGWSVVEVPVSVMPPASTTVRLVRDGSHMLLELIRICRLFASGAYGRPRDAGFPPFRRGDWDAEKTRAFTPSGR